MVATIFSFTKAKPAKSEPAQPAAPPKARDWTNQELSDLYRAVASLGQAGVLVHVDRGLTDEGEPWVVLCRLDGEVFIHFCRMDGRYLLDSPALARPLRGDDFAQLIDRFVTQAVAAAAPNVVAFRASKVFLHPAALLTILVWSLYVWSSDSTEAHEAAGDNGLPLLLPPGSPDLNVDAALAPPLAGKPALLLDSHPADRLLGRLVQAIDQASGMSAANNAAAMQVLAVIGTLVLTSAIPHNPGSNDDSTGTIMIDTLPADTAPLARAVDVVDFQQAQAVWTGSQAATTLLTAHEPPEVAITPLPQMEAASQHLQALAELPASQRPDASPAAPIPETATASSPPTTPANTIAPAAPPSVVDLPQPALSNDFAALLGTPLTLASYEVNGINLVASFDLAAAPHLQIGNQNGGDGQTDLLIDAPQLAHEPQAGGGGVYDEAARAFIDYFLEHADNVQVLASATELVLIDFSAFDDTVDHAFAYSWTLQDGGTISTLGHYEFFASHALV